MQTPTLTPSMEPKLGQNFPSISTPLSSPPFPLSHFISSLPSSHLFLSPISVPPLSHFSSSSLPFQFLLSPIQFPHSLTLTLTPSPHFPSSLFFSHISSSFSPPPDRPTTTIIYQQLSVTSSTPYRLNLTHGDEGLTFVCTSSGYFPPTLTWQKDNGGSPLPDHINPVVDSSGVQPIHELRWSRSLRHTDSGTYSCTAENDNGTDTATLDLLVQCELVLWAGL